MKLSISTSSYMTELNGSRVPISACIQLIEKAGFDTVDVFFGDAASRMTELSQEDWEDWAKKLRETLDKKGIQITQAHAPYYNFLSPDIQDAEYKEEMIQRTIIASDLLGVKWVVIHPGTNYTDNYLDENVKENVKWYSRFLEIAEKQKNGVGIAVENLFDAHHLASGVSGSKEKSDKRVNDYIVSQRRFGTSVSELLYLVEALKKEYNNVGICWDFGHANLASANHTKALQLIGNHLKALHVNDNLGVFDDHLIPFHGTVPWTEVMRTLKEIKYEGDFAYEAHLITKRMPEDLVLETFKYSYKIGQYLLSL